jgi:HEAT repeat protein
MEKHSGCWLFLFFFILYQNSVLADDVLNQIARLGDKDSEVRLNAVNELFNLSFSNANVRLAPEQLGDLRDLWRLSLPKNIGGDFSKMLLGDVRIVEPLISCLKDQDWRIREKAVETLSYLGDARAVSPLLACLKDQKTEVQENAIDALGFLGNAEAIEPIAIFLKDTNSYMRFHAAMALGFLADPRAFDILNNSVKTHDDFCQRTMIAMSYYLVIDIGYTRG